MNAQSKAPTYQHAATLRDRKLFKGIHEAFWKEPPFLRDVIKSLETPAVYVVPLFISEGYFTLQAIPRELGLISSEARLQANELPLKRAQADKTIYYCGPIGTHESMTKAILQRANAIISQFPFPRAPKSTDTTLFIAGHGTEQNENSRRTIERQVELIGAMGVYAEVFPLFIEESPRIAECYELAKTKNIIVVPFFISEGMHTVEDIPVMLGEPERFVKERLQLGQPTWRNPTEKKGKRVWYAPSIGSEPYIAEIILERVREAQIKTA